LETKYIKDKSLKEEIINGLGKNGDGIIDNYHVDNRLVQQPGWLSHKSCGFSGLKPCKTTFLMEVV
jgi:hypothetical protein